MIALYYSLALLVSAALLFLLEAASLAHARHSRGGPPENGETTALQRGSVGTVDARNHADRVAIFESR